MHTRNAFGDLLSAEQKFFLQIKDETWGGKFVDVLKGTEFADRSVFRLQPEKETYCYGLKCIQYILNLHVSFCTKSKTVTADTSSLVVIGENVTTFGIYLRWISYFNTLLPIFVEYSCLSSQDVLLQKMLLKSGVVFVSVSTMQT